MSSPKRRYNSITQRLDNADLIDRMLARRWGSDQSFDYLQHITRWDAKMSMKTYRIELKMDFKNDELHGALVSVVRQYARDLLGAAMLLQDGYKPDIAIISDDAFEGRDSIELIDQNVTHDAA